MSGRKTETVSQRITSTEVSADLLKKAQEQWFHDDFRKRVLELICEHESTRSFESAVSAVIERYIKIKTSERTFWIIGIIIAGAIGYFLK